jgi:nucleotide-binding universal stress UspA family protein
MSAIVVAGVDGSHSSRVAFAWALREAADRGAAIRIVHVYPRQPADGAAQARNHGRLILSSAKAYARDLAPGVRVDLRLATGDTTYELLSAASNAELLVVGACGGQRPARSAFGSTACDLAAQSRLPLAVVGRVPGRAHNRIVLGVDMRHPDSTSTRYAFEAARRAGVRLTLVYGSESPEASCGALRPDDMELARKKQDAELGRFADLWCARYPRTRIDHHMVVGMGENALIAASRGADLLVIGGRRPQPSPHHTGQVAHSVLSYAACPVVIAPYRA